MLNTKVEDAVLRGLKKCQCKVILSDPHGEHQEVMLPEGTSALGFKGTSCYMNLEAIAPELPSLLKPEGVPLEQVDRVNAYVSAAGSGTPLHFDMRAVWIVQLVGEKLWITSKFEAVEKPHRNCIAPRSGRFVDYDGKRLEIPNDFIVTVLRPGDWLFIPQAAWHATYSPEGSISATLAAPQQPK